MKQNTAAKIIRRKRKTINGKQQSAISKRRHMKIMRVKNNDGQNSDRNRTETVGIRVTPMELDSLIRTAEEAHEYPSSYLRRLFLQHIDKKQAHQTNRRNRTNRTKRTNPTNPTNPTNRDSFSEGRGEQQEQQERQEQQEQQELRKEVNTVS